MEQSRYELYPFRDRRMGDKNEERPDIDFVSGEVKPCHSGSSQSNFERFKARIDENLIRYHDDEYDKVGYIAIFD
ncbi:hypothetical protein AAVH_32771 [Aphelenchoides avenae]|nr:hypothetical protein AAVH_32771 [Aphelenchus avenae]